jgi:hypothetical protein
MMPQTKWVWMAALAGFLAPTAALGQTDQDRAGVERAALDYLEGFYEGDAAKIRSGVHPDVVKFGFFPSRSGDGYASEPMSFDQMIEFANGVKERGNFAPEDAPKEVIILEVTDQIAAVKVVAWWGFDYLHLANYDGEWKVIHVIWQSAPSG